MKRIYGLILLCMVLVGGIVRAQPPDDAIIVTETSAIDSMNLPLEVYWSPDSTSFMFGVAGADGTTMVNYDLASAELTVIDSDPRAITLDAEEIELLRADGPDAWLSPGGDRIFYRTTNEATGWGKFPGSTSRLYAIANYRPADERLTGLDFRLLPAGFHDPIYWNADGTAAFVSREYCCGTYLAYVRSDSPYDPITVGSLDVSACLRLNTVLGMTPSGDGLLYLSDDEIDYEGCNVGLWRLVSQLLVNGGETVLPEKIEFTDFDMPIGAGFIPGEPDALLVADRAGIWRVTVSTGEMTLIRADAFNVDRVVGVVFSPDARYALVLDYDTIYLLPLA